MDTLVSAIRYVTEAKDARSDLLQEAAHALVNCDYRRRNPQTPLVICMKDLVEDDQIFQKHIDKYNAEKRLGLADKLANESL